jgi:hypothetical protein
MNCFKLPNAAALAALLLAGLFAPVAQADQTFTINVPKRGFGDPAPPETANVRMIFEGPGVGTSSPQVNGTAFVDSANPANPCVAASTTCLGSFTYNSLSHGAKLQRNSANALQISFDLSNDLASNLCGNLTPAATTSRSFTLTLPTATTATSYRIASYTVPERASAANTAPKCDVAFRRVDTNRATATVVNPAIAAVPGRLPLDMVLVLDKSGSMGGGFSTPGAIRINRLKTSAALFVSTWESTDAVGNPGDRLGLVTFDSTAKAIPLDGANFFKSRDSATAWDGAVSQINTLSAGGSTTVGGSLTKAFEILNGVTGVNDATILLFTDGEQNTPPMLSGANPVKFACTASAPCVVGGSDLNGTRLMDKVTPVLSVGLGPTGSSFFQLLDDVSHETAGRAHLVFDPTLMDSVFVDNLIAALKGNTLSLNARALGTMGTADATSPPLTASIDGSVKRVSFVMSWDGGNGESAEFAVQAPGGVNLNPVLIKRGAFYRVLTYDVTGPQMIGDWKATVVRFPGGESVPTLQYHISVVSVEGRLSYEFHESARLGTGKPVTLRAELGWDGVPLDNLPAGSIKATIERPGENVGNILHDSTVVGDPKSAAGDAQDALSAKIDQLVANDNLIDRTTPKPLPDTVVLVHKGDGIYEGTFDKATVGGQYRLRFDLDWTDSRTNQIRRSEVLDRSIPVAATAASSVSLTQINAGAGTASILITPKDAIGNFVGPGYGALFDVTVTGGGTPVLPLVDATNRGLYTLEITGIPAGADPQVKITYRDETLRDAPVSKIDDANQGPGPGPDCAGWKCIPWWVWLLILLIVIILFLLWRRRSTP